MSRKTGVIVLGLLLLFVVHASYLGQWEWLVYVAAPVIVLVAAFAPWDRFTGKNENGISPLFKDPTPHPEQITKGEFSVLPESIKAKAFCAPNGEVVLKKADLDFAFSELAKAGFAVLGTELWVVEKDRILGLIPMKDGGTGVCGWSLDSRNKTETWGEYTQRTVKAACEMAAQDGYEKDVDPEVLDKLYYNVTFVNEAEYKGLGKS